MLSDEVGFEQLVTEYVALRRSLARNFRELAQDELGVEGDALEPLKNQISQRMRELFGGRIPDQYLRSGAMAACTRSCSHTLLAT
jgi:hypothetical protein